MPTAAAGRKLPRADGASLILSCYTTMINMRLSHAGAVVVLVVFPVLAILSLAGGTSGIQFTEAAGAAGIHAEMRCGGPEKRWIPEANGSGAAWLDYDNDGLMDLLVVNGSSMEQLRRIVAGQTPAPSKGGVYLFHNLGNGRFEDVTERAGLSRSEEHTSELQSLRHLVCRLLLG